MCLPRRCGRASAVEASVFGASISKQSINLEEQAINLEEQASHLEEQASNLDRTFGGEALFLEHGLEL